MDPRLGLPLRGRGAVPIALAIATMVLVSFAGAAIAQRGSTSAPISVAGAASSPISNAKFFFDPSTVNEGSQTNGNVSFSGGTPGYSLWFNQTPPGCSPPSNPMTTPSPAFTFVCQPTSTGTYTVHLDILDSATPVDKASVQATLNVVQGNNGNGNGNGNNSNNNNNGGGNGSLSLPGGLLQLAVIAGLVFFAALFLIAGGMIAAAVLLSRRLRQVNETLTKLLPPPKGPTPPTG